MLPVRFAEVVSVCSGVICYHDWLLGGCEGMYCALTGKSDTFVGLFDLIGESFDAAADIV